MSWVEQRESQITILLTQIPLRMCWGSSVAVWNDRDHSRASEPSHDPCNPCAVSLWSAVFWSRARPAGSLGYPRSWRTAVQSLITATTANWCTSSCSSDDKTPHPSVQSNSSSSTWTYSPRHSANSQIQFDYWKIQSPSIVLPHSSPWSHPRNAPEPDSLQCVPESHARPCRQSPVHPCWVLHPRRVRAPHPFGFPRRAEIAAICSVVPPAPFAPWATLPPLDYCPPGQSRAKVCDRWAANVSSVEAADRQPTG